VQVRLAKYEPDNDRVGSRAAVRRNARMLQHCLSKQTLCRRDCGPLERQEPSFAVMAVARSDLMLVKLGVDWTSAQGPDYE
jgi:hypothetical protein